LHDEDSVTWFFVEEVMRRRFMKGIHKGTLVFVVLLAVFGLAVSPPASAQEKKPNILVIMGDDVGWFNIGAYHRGMMPGKTPNLDKLAAQGRNSHPYRSHRRRPGWR
jgi:hypothetical protein